MLTWWQLHHESRVKIVKMRKACYCLRPMPLAREELNQPFTLSLCDKRPNQRLFFVHARSYAS
jgi:hypothetical protein